MANLIYAGSLDKSLRVGWIIFLVMLTVFTGFATIASQLHADPAGKPVVRKKPKFRKRYDL